MVDDEHYLRGKVGQLGVLLDCKAGIAQQLVAHPPRQRLHHRALILKIQIKRAFAHLCPAGDILHAGLGGAPLQKQLVGCIQQGAALFLFLTFHGAHAMGRFLFSLNLDAGMCCVRPVLLSLAVLCRLCKPDFLYNFLQVIKKLTFSHFSRLTLCPGWI